VFWVIVVIEEFRVVMGFGTGSDCMIVGEVGGEEE
jgi:hypothetical protein